MMDIASRSILMMRTEGTAITILPKWDGILAEKYVSIFIEGILESENVW